MILKHVNTSGKRRTFHSLQFLKVCVQTIMFFKCRKLKKSKKIFNTWFFNNVIDVQLTQNGEIKNIFHIADRTAMLKIDDMYSFLLNL